MNAPVQMSRAMRGSSSAEMMVLTCFVDEQMLGIPILRVQDVLIPQRITRIPLAPPEVVGSINLRGRIVTLIDVRTRLGMPKLPEDAKAMCVTVEQHGELYSLLVDRVGDVLTVTGDSIESSPTTLNRQWRAVSSGIIRLQKGLMVVVEVDSLLRF